jgi:type IV pilus assembly protein PilY1
VLGDITFAEPVLVKGSTNMIYQVANDGMVHAVNATTGQELWAYVPGLILPRINQITPLGYMDHVYVLDGTPAVGSVGGNTVLIGGLRNGGSGYYALNITNPAAASSTEVASKVLWEFRDANMGYTYGKPIITNTAHGSVALLTSGYNNADGQGHLFVVNPLTGVMIRDLTTGSGTPANPSGLAQIAAFTSMTSNGSSQIADVIYGGDLNGDLWRFDLTNSNPANWSVSKLASLKDASGNVQPITSAPEIGIVNGKRLIMVGTGKLLELGDLTSNTVQTVYGIADPMDASTITSLRSVLQQQSITVGAGQIGTTTSVSVDWSSKKGWYFDLPAGQIVNTDMSLAYGVLNITTNDPDQTQGCHGAMSYLYMIDYTNGGQLNGSYFPEGLTPWASKVLGNSYASSPTVAITMSGKLTVLVHEADGKIVGGNVTPANARNTTKVAWAEILK